MIKIDIPNMVSFSCENMEELNIILEKVVPITYTLMHIKYGVDELRPDIEYLQPLVIPPKEPTETSEPVSLALTSDSLVEEKINTESVEEEPLSLEEFKNRLKDSVSSENVSIEQKFKNLLGQSAIEAAIALRSSNSNPLESNELDSSGLPWDQSLHSETKSKRKDGTWRPRRGSLVKEKKASFPPKVTPIPPPPSELPETEEAQITRRFSELMKKVTRMLGARVISLEELLSMLIPKGVSSLEQLFTRPDLFDAVDELLIRKEYL